MHLREARQRNGQRALRYLHATYAHQNDIEGMISGAGVFWHYRLGLVGGRTQIQVFSRVGSPSDEARILSRFLPELLERMREEQSRSQQQHFSNYLHGQFYLRRAFRGCQRRTSTASALSQPEHSTDASLRSWALGTCSF